MTLEDRCRSLASNLGLCATNELTGYRPLTGGVASDIAAVSINDRTVCMKFALAKLRVAEEWFAPVHRGQAEYAWLNVVAQTVPSAVPELLGWSDSDNGFAMEYIDGPGVQLWKTALLASVRPQEEPAAVAKTLGLVHAASALPSFDRSRFNNSDDFDALRLEPYLRFTATHHPRVAQRLTELADHHYRSRVALVHGDVSPKNILLRNGQPIFLDAECATMGDPAFDVAFCINHLVLKSFHLPLMRDALLASCQVFWSAYVPHVDWENSAALESRVAALLPALMLARIDGKSPVEYLSEPVRCAVRSAALSLIEKPVAHIADVISSL